MNYAFLRRAPKKLVMWNFKLGLKCTVTFRGQLELTFLKLFERPTDAFRILDLFKFLFIDETVFQI